MLWLERGKARKATSEQRLEVGERRVDGSLGREPLPADEGGAVQRA